MIRNCINCLSELIDAFDVNFILFNSWENWEALGPNVIKYWFYLFKPSFHWKEQQQKNWLVESLHSESLYAHTHMYYTLTHHRYTNKEEPWQIGICQLEFRCHFEWWICILCLCVPMRRIALGLMEGNSLTTEVMSALNDQLTYIFSCLKRRYIQPLLLFQSSPGVRPKLVCLLNSFPALSCSLTSVSPVFLFLFASFCVSFSMFSLNVLDYPLIFKREPLKY